MNLTLADYILLSGPVFLFLYGAYHTIKDIYFDKAGDKLYHLPYGILALFTGIVVILFILEIIFTLFGKWMMLVYNWINSFQ